MAAMEEELAAESEDSPEDGDPDPDDTQMSEQRAGSGDTGDQPPEEVL